MRRPDPAKPRRSGLRHCGFFLASYDHLLANHNLNKAQILFKHETFSAMRSSPTRAGLLMNMFLHNIGEIDGESPVSSTDALIADSGKRYDYVWPIRPSAKKAA